MDENEDILFELVDSLGFPADMLTRIFKGNGNTWPAEFAYWHKQDFGDDFVIYRINFACQMKVPEIKGFKAMLYQRDLIEMPDHYFSFSEAIGQVDAREAYNMLCGRHIMKFEEPPSLRPYWAGLERIPGQEELSAIRRPADFDLGTLLRKLPILEMAHPETSMALIQALLKGELADAHLFIAEKPIEVKLSVDVLKQDLAIHDPVTSRIIILEDLFRQNEQKKTFKPLNIQKKKSGKGKGLT